MRRLSVFWQLFLTYGLLVLLALGLLGGIVGMRVEQYALQRVRDELRSTAALVQEAVRDRRVEDVEGRLAALHDKVGARVTLIAPDGAVLFETGRDGAGPDGRAHRPEVEAARDAPFGTATRFSDALGQPMMYLATRAEGTDPSVGFVHVALPLTEAQAEVSRLRNLVWVAAGVTAALALLLAYVLARSLSRPLQELNEGARQVGAGGYGHKVYIDRNDEVGALAQTFNHMSERLALQFAQLDADRQQLRAVLGSMVEGVIAVDAGQRILFANERAGQMLEFAPRSAAGRKLWQVVRQRSVHDVVEHALGASNGTDHELSCTGPSNKSFNVHVTPLPGEPVRGAVLVFYDTTELRRLERLRQEFVSNVSHELKTPLSVIVACVETLLDGGMDDVAHRQRFLERIADQAHRLHSLILDLLSLARIETGELNLSPQEVPLEAAVRSCVERHEDRAKGKNQRLEVQPPAEGDGAIRAWADEEAVREILDNLVDNALKYTPEGGTIRLRWWADGEQCGLEVSDTGIGIPESELPRVFERFYRVDKARSRELGGTGLGLSIVKHLVQALQGSVRADSRLGKGTRFTVTLPRPAC